MASWRMAVGTLVALGAVAGSRPCLAVAPQPPHVVSGRMLRAEVDVARPVASPRIELTFDAPTNFVYLEYTGPSGEVFSQGFTDPQIAGFPMTVQLQGYYPAPTRASYQPTALSLYAEAGTWTVTKLEVCQTYMRGQNCFTYTGASISAVFPSAAFKVINPDTPDVAAPAPQTATIKTKTLSVAAKDRLQIAMHATDNLSGVEMISACAYGPPGGGMCANSPPAYDPRQEHFLLEGPHLPSSTVTGTYTIYSLQLWDIAGNMVYITNGDTISALFKGKVTFDVTH